MLVLQLFEGVVQGLEALEPRRFLSAPAQWLSRGPGGGGALFSPSFSPYHPNELWIVTDMSEVFHSTDLGKSWTFPDFRQIQGGRASQVQFTSDPNTLYTLDYNDLDGTSGTRPSKSADGGVHWSALPAWSLSDSAYSLFADPNDTQRLIVTDYGKLFFSSDGGQSFNLRFTDASGAGAYVAGAFFDGNNIYVGTDAGLLVSTDGGATFNLSTATGLPAGKSMFSFSGAKQNGTTRLFCSLLNSGDVYAGMLIEGVANNSYSGIYSMDIGQSSWQAKTTGIPATEYPFFVSMARNDINTLYAAGTDSAGNPAVLKSTDAGGNWGDVLHVANNQNVATGWQGAGGDRGWGFSQLALGFEVAPLDSSRVAFTDFGYVHVTTDGGADWQQAYVNPADQNPAGSTTPQHKAYHGVGLEDTSAHWISWADSTNLVAGFTDIYGVRSTDAGNTWAFPTGISLAANTVYNTSVLATNSVPSGVILYAATSNTHDIYQSTHLTNASVDSGTGNILYSIDKGATWSLLHAFGHPVIYTALDPNNPNRLYASVISSTAGGIFVTSNLNLGASATWTKLSNPPRTEGHPFNIQVLNDGTLVASYSGHRNPNFTASSGVFVSVDGGATWLDRTLIGVKGSPGMQFWTKDFTIDPTDLTQNTWFAAVRSGYGGDGSANDKGGLYRTTNRGVAWTRVFSTLGVESATVNGATGEMYVATTEDGLWYSNNFHAASPTFAQLAAYPFRQPERVFVNPYNPAELWVASFGFGVTVGLTGPLALNGNNIYLKKDADGQNLDVWTDAATPGIGMPTQKVLFNTFNHIAVTGGTGNDILTLDFSAGNFTATLPGGITDLASTNGANLIAFVGTAGADRLTAAGGITPGGGLGTSPIALSKVQSIQLIGGSGGADVLSVTGGTYAINADTASGNPNISVVIGAGANVTFPGLQRLAALTINGGKAVFAVTGSPNQNSIGTLSISAGGQLDLGNHNLLLSTTPVATVRSYLVAGYSGGAWNGAGGIDSSAAAADLTGRRALGYGDSADGVTQGLGPGQVLVKSTVYGDANLDGVVDIADFGKLSVNFGATTGARWVDGDFTYDGAVDIADFGKLSFNFGATAPAGSAGTDAAFGTALPTPVGVARRRYVRSGRRHSTLFLGSFSSAIAAS